MSHISDNIKKIRGLLKETQEVFSARMEVSVGMQKSYESGKANPDIVYLHRLEELTGVKSKELTDHDAPIETLNKNITLVKSAEKDKKDEIIDHQNSVVNESQAPYGKSVQSDKILADLISSNRSLADAARIQAEAAKIRAEADVILARNVEDLIALTKVSTAGDVVQTQIETVAIVKVLQEHIFDLEAQVTGKNVREIKQVFYSKVKAVKDPIGKKGSHVGQGST
jgi:transcriptional regulator with XRE-family HTH domain